MHSCSSLKQKPDSNAHTMQDHMSRDSAFTSPQDRAICAYLLGQFEFSWENLGSWHRLTKATPAENASRINAFRSDLLHAHSSQNC